MDGNVYDVNKIMKRYDVSMALARKIMHDIEAANGGLTISRGRILLSEIEFYERTRGGRDVEYD